MRETGTEESHLPQAPKKTGGLCFGYPFLFSLHPAFSLYLHNIREADPIRLFWAAAASMGIALAYWPITRLFSNRLEKRALALFLFLLLFQSYGLYYQQIAGLLPETLSLPAAHALAFAVPGGAWILLTFLVIRSRRSFSVLGRVLGIAVLAMLGWNIAGMLLHHGGALARSLKESRTGGHPAFAAPAAAPDIYCFVLDEFASVGSMRRLFGHDHAPFTDSLRRRGFIVSEGSKARFTETGPAIADILNLGQFAKKDNSYLAVRRSAAVAFLKQRGYRIIDFACLESLFLDGADRRVYYDLVRASVFFDDFYRALFERSLLRVLPDMWRRRKTDLTRYYRQRVLQVFAELPGAVREASPKFVFVHLFSPHEPFVFDRQGGEVDPDRIWDHADPKYYLEQYIYISRRLLETADMILGNSPRAPVILLQSDHGYRGSRRRGNRVPPEEMSKVFNALYLPGVPRDKIDPSLTPRNNFRLVFNFYFGTHYDLLPAL